MYTKISSPLANNVPFMINPHMLQLLSTFYKKSNEEPHEFLDEFIYVCMTSNIPRVPKEYLKMRIFHLALKDKAKEWLNPVGQEFTSLSETKKNTI